MKADEMLEELGELKSLIWEMLPSDFIKLLETNNYVLIEHPNIKENHLDRYGLHLNHDGTRVLVKNLRLCGQKYWHNKDSLKETFTLLNIVQKHLKQITNDLNH